MIRRVLIVDDSFYACSSLKHLLESHGYEVVGAAFSPSEAVNLYAQTKPDLVTMDIVMPEGGGLEAIKALRVQDPNARIIVVSALEQDAVMKAARELGVGVFVKKPIHWPELERALQGLPA